MWTKPVKLQSAKEVPTGNGYFLIEGLGICYNAYPIRNADPETFVWQMDFAKDKKRCYRITDAFKDADPKTFEVLNIYFAKDKNHIYTIGGPCKNIDYDTFEVLDPGFTIDEDNRRRKLTSYAKDRNGLYMMEYYSNKPVSIKGIDADSFQPINSSYAKDKKFVLWRGNKLKKADPASFIALNSNYGKDTIHVYAQDELLVNADHASFEVVAGNITLAKDKHSFYQFTSVITEQEFREELVHDKMDE